MKRITVKVVKQWNKRNENEEKEGSFSFELQRTNSTMWNIVAERLKTMKIPSTVSGKYVKKIKIKTKILINLEKRRYS